MIDTEKFIKTIAEGDKFLTSISHLHPMKIKGILEDVYETNKYRFSEFLQDEYNSRRVFDIIYDKDGNITLASLRWNYWDGGAVKLTCTGIDVVFIPEYGPQETIAELPWEIVKPYFKEIL